MAPAQGPQPRQKAATLQGSEEENVSQDPSQGTQGDEIVKEFARNMRRDVCDFLRTQASKLTWIDHDPDQNST